MPPAWEQQAAACSRWMAKLFQWGAFLGFAGPGVPHFLSARFTGHGWFYRFWVRPYAVNPNDPLVGKPVNGQRRRFGFNEAVDRLARRPDFTMKRVPHVALPSNLTLGPERSYSHRQS